MTEAAQLLVSLLILGAACVQQAPAVCRAPAGLHPLCSAQVSAPGHVHHTGCSGDGLFGFFVCFVCCFEFFVFCFVLFLSSYQ